MKKAASSSRGQIVTVPRHRKIHAGSFAGKPPKANGTDTFGVLFTCIGRRVSLLNSFRQAAKDLRLNASFFGTDTSELTPALQLCDKGFLVRPVTHPDYVSQLLTIVKTSRIRLLVPTIDTDLLVLAKNKTKFADLGCTVLVSEPEVVQTCQDKRKAYRFLTRNGLNAPKVIGLRTALTTKKISWPCVLKPWDGAAARNVTFVNNRKELAFFAAKTQKIMCQEFVRGAEYTCDVYVGFNLEVRCVVPRKRIEVRGGEVSKGQTVKNRRIMSEAARVVKMLKAGPGVITVQCFLEKNGTIKFNDINARFGGGAPLAIKAGADFPKWILQELVGKKPRIKFDGFKNGLILLRYDAEVWLHNPAEKATYDI